MLAPGQHDLDGALARINQLGVFPDAAIRILDVTQDPTAQLTDLERAVASDPVLSARVLQVANSPLYGLSQSIGTLSRAVQMLGMDGTRGVAFALAVSAVGAHGGPLCHELYLHALASASVVRLAGPLANGVHSGMLFVTALVHNLGLQLLLILEPESSRALLERFGHNAMLTKAERVHFGFDHAQLGAEGMRQWGLPDPAAELIAHHHDPVAKTQRSRALLAIADDVADAILAGDTVAGIAALASDHPLGAPLGLSDVHWMTVVDQVPEVMSELTV
ncbi:MAG: HDOD domain-containing protein [Myxococcota bacterium]